MSMETRLQCKSQDTGELMTVGYPSRVSVGMEWNQTSRACTCVTGCLSGGMEHSFIMCPDSGNGAAGLDVFPIERWSDFDHSFPCSDSFTFGMGIFILCHSMLEVYRVFIIL